MKIEIRHRYTNAILFSIELPDDTEQPQREALRRANLAGANLARANLDGANLDGANLDGANLDGAYLAGARGLPPGVEHTDPTEPYRRPTTDAEIEAVRHEHMLRFRARNPEVPVVAQLDQKAE